MNMEAADSFDTLLKFSRLHDVKAQKMILLEMNWFTRRLVNSKIINPCRLRVY